jgi:hypothetical protein
MPKWHWYVYTSFRSIYIWISWQIILFIVIFITLFEHQIPISWVHLSLILIYLDFLLGWSYWQISLRWIRKMILNLTFLLVLFHFVWKSLKLLIIISIYWIRSVFLVTSLLFSATFKNIIHNFLFIWH